MTFSKAPTAATIESLKHPGTEDREVVSILNNLLLSYQSPYVQEGKNDKNNSEDDLHYQQYQRLLHQLRQQVLLHRPPRLWKWTTVSLFVEWVFGTTSTATTTSEATLRRTRPQSDIELQKERKRQLEREQNTAIMMFTNAVEDEWTEEQIFALSLYQLSLLDGAKKEMNSDNHQNHVQLNAHQPTILEILKMRLDHADWGSVTYVVALTALTTMWRSLDRLQTLMILPTISSSSMVATPDIGVPRDVPWWRLQPYWKDEEHSDRPIAATTKLTTGSNMNSNNSSMFGRAIELFQWIDTLKDDATSHPSKTIGTAMTTTEIQEIGLRPEEIQIAALTFLLHSCKYSSIEVSFEWIVNDESKDGIYFPKLLVMASRLCDLNMPRTSYTHLSLTCLHVLISTPYNRQYHHHYHHQESSQINSMIRIVVHSLLDGISSSSARQRKSPIPRWTGGQLDLYKWTLPIVMEWTYQQKHSISDIVSSSMVLCLWQPLIGSDGKGYNDSLKTPSSFANPFHPCLYYVLTLLLRFCRKSARSGLVKALEGAFHHHQQQILRENGSNLSSDSKIRSQSFVPFLHAMISKLLGHGETETDGAVREENSNHLGKFIFLHALLVDGQSIATHDILSKAMWNAFFFEDITSTVSSTSTAPDENRLLDTLFQRVFHTASMIVPSTQIGISSSTKMIPTVAMSNHAMRREVEEVIYQQRRQQQRILGAIVNHPILQIQMDVLYSFLTHTEVVSKSSSSKLYARRLLSFLSSHAIELIIQIMSPKYIIRVLDDSVKIKANDSGNYDLSEGKTSIVCASVRTDGTDLMEDETDDIMTPTANNLSRIVLDSDDIAPYNTENITNDTSIGSKIQHTCVEYKVPPTGIESTLALSAAGFLASLIQVSFVDLDVNEENSHKPTKDITHWLTRHSPLRGRILEAVHAFIEEWQFTYVMPFNDFASTWEGSDSINPTFFTSARKSLTVNTSSNVDGSGVTFILPCQRFPMSCCPSYDLTRRRLCVLNWLACSREHQDYLASLMHRVEISHYRVAHQMDRQVALYQQRIEELEYRERQLLAEATELEQRRIVHDNALQQTLARYQRQCSSNAKQLIEVHQLESLRSERRAEEAHLSKKVLQERLSQIEEALLVSRRTERESQKALEQAQQLTEELQKLHQASIDEVEARSLEAHRAHGELQMLKPKLDRLIRNEKKMTAHIQSQVDSIRELEDSRTGLKDSLETLFGDMVSLTHLYEAKEKDERKGREQDESSIENLTRKLQSEQARYTHLEELYRQTEVNNNMLSSKYEKVRKLLEKEREDRTAESIRFATEQRKRSGAAPYMSHLHTSTTSTSSKSKTKETGGHSRMRLVLSNDKENSPPTSNSTSKHSRSKCR